MKRIVFCLLVAIAIGFLITSASLRAPVDINDHSVFTQQADLSAIYANHKDINMLNFSELIVSTTGEITGQSPLCGEVDGVFNLTAEDLFKSRNWTHFSWLLQKENPQIILVRNESLGAYSKEDGIKEFGVMLNAIHRFCSDRINAKSIAMDNKNSWTVPAATQEDEKPSL